MLGIASSVFLPYSFLCQFINNLMGHYYFNQILTDYKLQHKKEKNHKSESVHTIQ
jgi:uncharacterized protein (DUF2164 family)